MPTPPIGRIRPSPAAFCQRLPSSRRRAVLSLLALTALLAMLWLAYRFWAEWPTKAILRTPGNTWFLAFSPDSRTIATSNADGITVWDAEGGRQRATWDGLKGQFVGSGVFVSGVFSPDGRTFAAALSAYPRPLTIALIDVDSGRLKVSLPTQHTGVFNLAFTDAGRNLRALLLDIPDPTKEVLTWDVATGEQASSRPLSCPPACDMAVSPDGHLLALAPYNGATIRIWDLDGDRGLTRLANLSTVERLGRGLAFAADSRTLAVSREDGSFELWDVPTRRLKKALRGHTGGYVSNGIELAPDGRTLASRGDYYHPTSLPGALRLATSQALFGRTWTPAREVIVVDIGTDRRLARAANAVHPFYSPDSATIATYESDLTIRLRPSPARPR
jgi:WD40 repeat protein